ncbi:MAG: S8 family serine peptidase [Micromonosporaceae bacterium]|nr:S8 family serine peptidase [Micromonosporaceae bacterium]
MVTFASLLSVPLTMAFANGQNRVTGVGTVLVPRGEVRVIDPPNVDRLVSLDAPNRPGIEVTASNGAILVAVAASTPMPRTTVVAFGTACLDGDCAVPYKLHLTVLVGEAGIDPTNSVDHIAVPSPDRLAAGRATGFGEVELPDEVLVTISANQDAQEVAEAVADAEGATIVGGLADLGLFQLRWSDPVDLDTVLARMSQHPGVADVSPSSWGGIGTTSTDPPGDWDDDGAGGTWPWDLIHARDAWDMVTGSTTTVGVVDYGVFGSHADLVVEYDGRAYSRHGTHVAGIACAAANGQGIVGVAWGCPVLDGAIPDYSATDSWLAVIAAARDLSQRGAKVINVSLGKNFHRESDRLYRCASESEAASAAADQLDRWGEPFRRLFDSEYGRGVVWTLSAGNNCVAGAQSAMQQVAAEFDNVLVVSAVNSDGTLASFSNWGPETVAAPGGVLVAPEGNGTTGVWSTSIESCAGVFTCDSWEQMAGTSQASAVVAGLAALIIEAHPEKTAREVAQCIRDSVGPPVTVRSTYPADRSNDGRGPYVFPAAGEILAAGVVNAPAAVSCAPAPSSFVVSTPQLDVVEGVAFDSSGAIYTAGYTAGQMSGAPHFGANDLFVQKHRGSGGVHWVSQFGTTASEGNTALDVDADSVFFAGTIRNAFPADRTYGTTGLGPDWLLRRYTTSGQIVWTVRFDLTTPGTSWRPLSIDANADGVSVLTTSAGAFDGQATSNANDSDCWLWDFTLDGELNWVTRLGSNRDEFCHDVARDTEGSAFVALDSAGVIPAPGERSSPNSNNVAALAKVNAAGVVEWVRRIGEAAGTSHAYSVAVAPDGRVLVAGGALGPINGATIRKGLGDAYVQWYTATGDLVGAARYGRGGVSAGINSVAEAIAAVDGHAVLAVRSSWFDNDLNRSVSSLTAVALTPTDEQLWVHEIAGCTVCAPYSSSLAAGPGGVIAVVHVASSDTDLADGIVTLLTDPST